MPSSPPQPPILHRCGKLTIQRVRLAWPQPLQRARTLQSTVGVKILAISMPTVGPTRQSNTTPRRVPSCAETVTRTIDQDARALTEEFTTVIDKVIRSRFWPRGGTFPRPGGCRSTFRLFSRPPPVIVFGSKTTRSTPSIRAAPFPRNISIGPRGRRAMAGRPRRWRKSGSLEKASATSSKC
jgi:hypothetical protein